MIRSDPGTPEVVNQLDALGEPADLVPIVNGNSLSAAVRGMIMTSIGLFRIAPVSDCPSALSRMACAPDVMALGSVPATAGSSPEHTPVRPDMFLAETPAGRYQGVTEQVEMSRTPGFYQVPFVARGSSSPTWLWT